jgi:hypothetical protein
MIRPTTIVSTKSKSPINDNDDDGGGNSNHKGESENQEPSSSSSSTTTTDDDKTDEENNENNDDDEETPESPPPPPQQQQQQEDDVVDVSKVLQQYNASHSPVIPHDIFREGMTVQVHLIVDLTRESTIVDPSSKFLRQAIERSQYMQLHAITFIRNLPPYKTVHIHEKKDDEDVPFLYVVDWGSMNRDCHRLQLIMETIQQQQQQQQQEKQRQQEEDDPYMLLVDFTGSTRQTICDDYYLVSNNNNRQGKIRLAKRSIVQDRYYDHTTKQIHLGNVVPNRRRQSHDDDDDNDELPILHSPLVLRESFVNAIYNVTKIGESIYKTLKRPIDVGYFWNTGDYSHFSFYRRDVAKVVKTLHHSKITQKKRMENDVNLAYTDKKGYGENNVQMEYINKLLSCKIVVITQRDEYEDNFRLMESLASGALVVSDRMTALPSGLIDKVNIVFYDSPSDLKKLIRYYLQPENEKERMKIAAEGYKLAMGRHRCWHRLEELVFGRPLTNVDKPKAIAPMKEVAEYVTWIDTDDDAGVGNFV